MLGGETTLRTGAKEKTGNRRKQKKKNRSRRGSGEASKERGNGDYILGG